MIVTTCLECKHYEADMKCTAFNLIPNEIWEGLNEHKKPLKRQENDVVFEPIQKGKGG